ncbi:hypothetical protein PPTG_15483 [Phytophthora nicotianae INRA-310]|uniref:Uncharacterized protein n=1 Tax=Phytophthora nicotianae (strain INRA-310) TaxID=761204 RepID=W2PP04_PHYN3|nr:hypothetical protein PPTG_15483 [Phytophthora nicotianae INRA-310]ETN02728.1 hypothetical protein PPTG_15483 [Phytophthora nicotianae INRA-310]
MAGNLTTRCCLPGYIVVERQHDVSPTEDTARRDQSRQQTGVEQFEVVTCRANCSSDQNIKVKLPDDPGYAWLGVRGINEAASSSRSSLYFYAVALHYGARQVPGNGDLQALQLNWLPGLLEFFPTLESRRRRCLKGNLRVVTSSNGGMLQELTLVAQRLSTSRLERYAAQIESRLLRIDKAAAELDEERGATVAGIQNLVKSSAKQAQIQLWLAQKKSADAAFKLFELEKAEGRLFGMKGVLAWANHVTKLNKKNAGATMLEALLKHYDDAALAEELLSG